METCFKIFAKKLRVSRFFLMKSSLHTVLPKKNCCNSNWLESLPLALRPHCSSVTLLYIHRAAILNWFLRCWQLGHAASLVVKMQADTCTITTNNTVQSNCQHPSKLWLCVAELCLTRWPRWHSLLYLHPSYQRGIAKTTSLGSNFSMHANTFLFI